MSDKLVKPTSIEELTREWGFRPAGMADDDRVFIECDAEGNSDFDKANVYSEQELDDLPGVRILNARVTAEEYTAAKKVVQRYEEQQMKHIRIDE